MTSSTKKKSIVVRLLRHKVLLFMCVALGAAGSMLQYKAVPKKFKVITTISLDPQYFHIPLVQGFLTETYDGQELRSHREGLIRRTLNHEFLKEIGVRYGLFPPKRQGLLDTYDFEELGRKFEIIPVGATSFLIGLYCNDPSKGYEVMKVFLDHVRQVMAGERRETLAKLHDAIKGQLESLSFGRQSGSASPVLESRPDLVRQEMERLQQEIRMLKTNYSDRHPRISELNERLNRLSKWLDPERAPDGSKPKQGTFSGANVDSGSKELFQDLVKKYHYLEVVMYLDQNNPGSYLTLLQEPFVPIAPLWPKRPIYLAWGIVIGFAAGSALVCLIELLAVRLAARKAKRRSERVRRKSVKLVRAKTVRAFSPSPSPVLSGVEDFVTPIPPVPPPAMTNVGSSEKRFPDRPSFIAASRATKHE